MPQVQPLGRLTDYIGLGVLSARFHRDVLEEVINRTGCREKRSRRVPAPVMMRYVIAMGLYAQESAEEVRRRFRSLPGSPTPLAVSRISSRS
jgi:hypothetical protein